MVKLRTVPLPPNHWSNIIIDQCLYTVVDLLNNLDSYGGRILYVSVMPTPSCINFGTSELAIQVVNVLYRTADAWQKVIVQFQWKLLCYMYYVCPICWTASWWQANQKQCLILESHECNLFFTETKMQYMFCNKNIIKTHFNWTVISVVSNGLSHRSCLIISFPLVIVLVVRITFFSLSKFLGN